MAHLVDIPQHDASTATPTLGLILSGRKRARERERRRKERKRTRKSRKKEEMTLNELFVTLHTGQLLLLGSVRGDYSLKA